MAILTEAEVRKIREERYATINHIESKPWQSPFDQCVNRDCEQVVSVAETCLAAMARADAAEEVTAKREKKEP